MSYIERKNKKEQLNNKGFSFVELICAIAILSIVTAAVSAIIVISSKTYRNSVSETTLQREAQLASNQIAELIRGANKVEFTTVSVTEPTLKISMDDQHEYKIIHETMNNALQYEEITYTKDINGVLVANSSGRNLLAENVTYFTADDSDFNDTRTVKIELVVDNDSKSYRANYTMTARNQEVHNIPDKTTVDFVDIGYEKGIILEPGQDYVLFVDHLNSGGLELTYDTGLSGPAELTQNSHEIAIHVASDVIADKLQIHWKSKTGVSSSDAGKAPIDIGIRRANNVTVVHTVDRSNSVDSTLGGIGTEFTFTAIVNASNAQRKIGKDWDNSYINPKTVTWDYAVIKDGYSLSDSEKANYVVEVPGSRDEDSDTPSITYRLVDTLTSNMELRVTAVSKHQMGTINPLVRSGEKTNKSGDRYCAIKNDGTADASPYNLSIYGTDSVKPRDTFGNEIIIEPLQIWQVPFNVALGSHDTVRCELRHEDGTAVTSDTKAEFLKVNEAGVEKAYINVTAGKDEKGIFKGYDSAHDINVYDNTFYVDVYINSAYVPADTITVHVRRVDCISIDVDTNAYDNDLSLMSEISYHFKARLNSGNGKHNLDGLTYLIANKEDARKAMAVKIEWKLMGDDDSGNTTYLSEEQVVAMFSEENSEKTVLYDPATLTPLSSDRVNEIKNRNNYYTVTDLSAGRWISATKVNVPQLKIHMKDNAPIPDMAKNNLRIWVRMTAMHPSGNWYSWNGTNAAYSASPVMAEVTVKLRTPSIDAQRLVVLEPNQGTDDKNSKINQAVVPIYIYETAVYKIISKETENQTNPTVLLSGNSDKDTRLAVYSKTNNTPGSDFNPIKVSNAQSSQGGKIFWTWNLGLLIGKDEQGKDGKGTISISHLAGMNNSKNVVCSMTDDVTVAVRRVNNVSLNVAKGPDWKSNLELQNKARLIVLEAWATGCDGTNYFERQSYESESEYKSPYEMLWTLDVEGRKYDLNNNELCEYVQSAVKIDDFEKKKQVLVLYLNKPLPKGTEIRATSLHAMGRYVNTDYNKSGIGYGDVYGRLVIEGDDEPNEYILDSADFVRGSPYNFSAHIATHGYKAIDADAKKSQYGHNVGGADFHYYFRFREEGQSWSQYYMCMNAGNVWQMDEKESQLFAPDKAYEIEYIGAVIDHNSKKIHWPLNNYLIEQAGVYTGFEEYTLYSDDERTKMSEFCSVFKLGRAGVLFDSADLVDIAKGNNLGSFDEPVIVSDENSHFSVSISGEYLNFGGSSGNTVFKDNIFFAFERYEDGEWKEVSMESNPFILTQNSNGIIDFYFDGTNTAVGKYRVNVMLKANFFRLIKDNNPKTPNSTVNSYTEQFYKEYKLSYTDIDKGFIYLLRE